MKRTYRPMSKPETTFHFLLKIKINLTSVVTGFSLNLRQAIHCCKAQLLMKLIKRNIFSGNYTLNNIYFSSYLKKKKKIVNV